MSNENHEHFRDMPTVTKTGEIPTGIWVLRINTPFTLRHLAQKNVRSAFLSASTTKSVRTFLQGEVLELNTFKDSIKKRIEAMHPSLRKRIGIEVATRIYFGHRNTESFVKNIPRLYKDMAELGISDLPLRRFAIPLKKPQPQWATFLKRKEAFICIQIGTRLYTDFDIEELNELIATNKILRDLNAYACETIEKQGTWLSCRVPKKEA